MLQNPKPPEAPDTSLIFKPFPEVWPKQLTYTRQCGTQRPLTFWFMSYLFWESCSWDVLLGFLHAFLVPGWLCLETLRFHRHRFSQDPGSPGICARRRHSQGEPTLCYRRGFRKGFSKLPRFFWVGKSFKRCRDGKGFKRKWKHQRALFAAVSLCTVAGR